MTLNYELIDEFRIATRLDKQIASLLQSCFPDSDHFTARSYSKQRPQRRLLVWEEDRLVGHTGLEHRTIGLETGPATIFGLIEVSVDQQYRDRGIASGMIRHIEQLGQEHQVDFLMLFAGDNRLYQKNGFQRRRNILRWSMIHEHRTLGVDEQSLEELMIKELADRRWPDGLVDLLGYQF